MKYPSRNGKYFLFAISSRCEDEKRLYLQHLMTINRTSQKYQVKITFILNPTGYVQYSRGLDKAPFYCATLIRYTSNCKNAIPGFTTGYINTQSAMFKLQI